MSYHVADDDGPPHRALSESGATVFVVDRRAPRLLAIHGVTEVQQLSRSAGPLGVLFRFACLRLGPLSRRLNLFYEQQKLRIAVQHPENRIGVLILKHTPALPSSNHFRTLIKKLFQLFLREPPIFSGWPQFFPVPEVRTTPGQRS